MKKILTYLASILLSMVIMTATANAGDKQYVLEDDDPNAVWWISVLFFNGPDHNSIQYYGEITPKAVGVGLAGKLDCEQRAERVAELMLGVPEFKGLPWAVLCTPISADAPNNIHRYNQSLTWLEDYPEEFRQEFDVGGDQAV